MGLHRKEQGVALLMLLKDLGRILGYFSTVEEQMFTGDSSSPDLDLTWRLNPNAKYPLFIFEVESTPGKSASDNAIKVFSRKTSIFEKPLFFFHVFIEDPIGKSRVEYLRDNYDKLNYDTYTVNDTGEQFRLISDILDQTMRLRTYFDLYSTIEFFLENKSLDVKPSGILELLVDRGYDLLNESCFLQIVEQIIIDKESNEIRDYYLSYLDGRCSNPHFEVGEYRNLEYYQSCFDADFLEVIHHIILLLSGRDSGLIHEKVKRIKDMECCFGTQVGWFPGPLLPCNEAPHLADSPLLLTLLCLILSPYSHALTFSGMLRYIIENKTKGFDHFNIHGLIWLLMASRIAKDKGNCSTGG
jgi:hypothetical protein